MSALHLPFKSRFEYKYLVPESVAQEFRRALRFHMKLDRYCENRTDNSYLVNSLYLDTKDFMCLRSTWHGEKNRFKIRLRWYEHELVPPVILEMKRRTTDSISKVRASATPELVRDVLAHRPLRSNNLQSSDAGRADARYLADTIARLDARPACYVRYLREAWAAPGQEYFRITFDRHLEGHAINGKILPAEKDGWVKAGTDWTILEIKFVQSVPDWARDLARAFQLVRCSVPKYVLCLDALGKPRPFRTAFPNDTHGLLRAVS